MLGRRITLGCVLGLALAIAATDAVAGSTSPAEEPTADCQLAQGTASDFVRHFRSHMVTTQAQLLDVTPDCASRHILFKYDFIQTLPQLRPGETWDQLESGLLRTGECSDARWSTLRDHSWIIDKIGTFTDGAVRSFNDICAKAKADAARTRVSTIGAKLSALARDTVPPAKPLAASTPPPTISSVDVVTGDRWVYFVIDDLAGRMIGTQTYTTTGQTDDRLDVAFSLEPASATEAPAKLRLVFDDSWNAIDNGSHFQPYDPSTGVELPLATRGQWQTKYSVRQVNGPTLSAGADTAVVGWEAIKLRTGLTYDAYHIRSVVEFGPTGKPITAEHVVDLWYAPAVNRFARRTVEVRENGRTVSRTIQELAAYAPAPRQNVAKFIASGQSDAGQASVPAPIASLDAVPASQALAMGITASPAPVKMGAGSIGASLAQALTYVKTKDYRHAFGLLLPLAKADMAIAQHMVGLMDLYGLGTTKDEAEGSRWIQKAAWQGDVGAEFLLAEIYRAGLGVAKDEKLGANWMITAAEHGSAGAQFDLGAMLELGQSFAKDDAEAADWYGRAAAQGLPQAEVRLGYFYSEGFGVAQNDTTAVEWYRKAADQGDLAGDFSLGLSYLAGRGVKRDFAQARSLILKSASQGYGPAQLTLSSIYLQGWGAAKDPAEAAKWLRRAADSGLALAQYDLGVLYERGLGVKADHGEAVRWWKKAASQHFGPAERALAVPPPMGLG